MIDIVIPAAGDGTRFKEAGYNKPKPMIDVCGMPMIHRVINNLLPQRREARFIVIHRLGAGVILKEEDMREGLFDLHIEAATGGAVDTILQARDYFGNDPLLIGNCDQLVAFDVDDFCTLDEGHNGSIVTFRSNKPHHSYVKTYDDDEGYGIVTAIAEKQVISHQAVTGVYYFERGQDFIRAADQVIADGEKVKGEFYVSSVIARMIAWGYRFRTYEAPSAMLGTPEELQLFEAAVAVGKTL